jgi:predicted RNase H-like nuclease (RuvC/YqgF family)
MNDHIPDLTKMIGETPCNATPREELRNQIMSSVIPKNEREWWANRTIEQLERELNASNKRIKELEAKVDELHDLEKWLEGR